MSNGYLGLLGMALRSGRLAVGDDAVKDMAAALKARAVFLASDAGESVRRQAAFYTGRGRIPLLELDCTRAELGGALGRSACAVCACSDAGLSAAAAEKAALARPENKPAADRLTANAGRIQMRKAKGKKKRGRVPAAGNRQDESDTVTKKGGGERE